jgi:hypothetical protein
MNSYNSFYKHDHHIEGSLEQVLELAIVRLNKEAHYLP